MFNNIRWTQKHTKQSNKWCVEQYLLQQMKCWVMFVATNDVLNNVRWTHKWYVEQWRWTIFVTTNDTLSNEVATQMTCWTMFVSTNEVLSNDVAHKWSVV